MSAMQPDISSYGDLVGCHEAKLFGLHLSVPTGATHLMGRRGEMVLFSMRTVAVKVNVQAPDVVRRTHYLHLAGRSAFERLATGGGAEPEPARHRKRTLATRSRQRPR